MKCLEVLARVWELIDRLPAERRGNFIMLLYRSYDMDGTRMSLTMGEEHLAACLDCESFEECNGNLRECRLVNGRGTL